MTDFIVRPAALTDSEDILRLVLANHLPAADLLPGNFPHFFVASAKNSLIGTAGLQVSENAALLRSVCVSEEFRSLGVGKALIAKTLGFAKTLNIGRIFLLTTTADKYFERLGFSRIDRNEAPEAIQKTAEFQSLCPAEAVCLVLTLE